MPYTSVDELPSGVKGHLDTHAQRIFMAAYNSAYSGTCKDKKDAEKESCCSRVAWGAVKNAGYEKGKDGMWHKSEAYAELSLCITKAAYDKPSGEMRWAAVASDTDPDSHGESMSQELFEDFVRRANSLEPAPGPFCTEGWCGGMPYLSIAHYDSMKGDAIPGKPKEGPEGLFLDGNRLKSKGVFYDTDLGRACFRSVCKDQAKRDEEKKTGIVRKSDDWHDNPVRISIAFLDWKHAHGDIVFERKSLTDKCPMCASGTPNKRYLSGQLVQLALTRVPVNTRSMIEPEANMVAKSEPITVKDDAASIVGEELADELDEKAKKALESKSEALVEKSEEQPCEGCEDETKTPAELPQVAEAETTVVTEETPVDEKAEDGEAKPEEVAEEQPDAEVDKAKTKTVGGESYPASDFLVVEDPNKPSSWHLQVKKHGKPDHGLMGAAMAALTSPGGHRGNKYEGPSKSEALRKLKALYKAEGMEWKSETMDEWVDIAHLIADEVKVVLSGTSISEPKIVPPTDAEKAIDQAYAVFRSDFAQAIALEGDAQAKLQLLQDSFNAFGNGVKAIVTAEAEKSKPAAEPAPEATPQNIPVALEGVLKSLAEQIQNLSGKVDVLASAGVTVQKTPLPIAPPQKRSLTSQPGLIALSKASDETKGKDGKMSVDQIAASAASRVLL